MASVGGDKSDRVGEKKAFSSRMASIQMSALDRNKKVLEAAGLSENDLKTLCQFPDYLEKVLSNAGVTSANERLRIIIELNFNKENSTAETAHTRKGSLARAASHSALKHETDATGKHHRHPVNSLSASNVLNFNGEPVREGEEAEAQQESVQLESATSEIKSGAPKSAIKLTTL
eukprot:CAMPEP_0197529396 /NCGR_PEP_ID=MMETSP1318-20131121/28296_1 /TAXON_ID=552666 /ORGANISM="Partenskyella glossopodia, Strain RCC365" /LENGTH=174 /DNA_ID=CAMNT_0043084841 /DNA_START=363 /DNA_END=887 /DNA_ORIENTATION=+